MTVFSAAEYVTRSISQSFRPFLWPVFYPESKYAHNCITVSMMADSYQELFKLRKQMPLSVLPYATTYELKTYGPKKYTAMKQDAGRS